MASDPRLRLRHLTTRLHVSDSDGLRQRLYAWPSNQSREVSNYYHRTLVVSCHSTKKEVQFLDSNWIDIEEIVILNLNTNEK